MNPLAKDLNEKISAGNPAVYDMLSVLGKELYMPKGIITQGAEAKQKATKFNATIGIATNSKGPMYLDCMYENFSGFKPEELFPYAPTTGIPELRKLWKEKMLKENPSLKGKAMSNPIVTSALTNGLSLASTLFTDKGDVLVLPDMFWGNYRLTFSVLSGAEIALFKSFDDKGHFNVKAFLEKVEEVGKNKGKVITVLNFPNNPTGYTPSLKEMTDMADGLSAIASKGIKIVALCDDAYFGLFYEKDCATESIFGLLADRHENILAIKLDGATKEEFVWGFRVGFITFSTKSKDGGELLAALETKTSGAIRGTISNCPTPSQNAVIKCLKNPNFEKDRLKCVETLKERALEVKNVLKDKKYADEFSAYPFNSGYFMCIKLHNKEAEKLRIHLLDKHAVGVISTSATDIRVAFSCVEKVDIKELFDIIYVGCKEI